MALVPGNRLGPYEIQAPLGAGGMGEVYRARDTRLERTVAIKVLPSAAATNQEARHRFEREARAIAALNHPHICVLHDVGRHQGVDFLVMEYMEGQTLAERLQLSPVPLDDALSIAIQICDALGEAHQAGVVHRDLKPGNVMLTRAGSSAGLHHAKLLDFGLARLGGASPGGSVATDVVTGAPLTTKGDVLGTFEYMAPEQRRGEIADAHADIWAVGCLLHEMITGEDLRARHVIRPAHLDKILSRCLADRPGDRWPSAGALRNELANVHRGIRRRTPVSWIVGGAAAALAMLAAVIIQRGGPEPAIVETPHAPVLLVVADFDNRTGEAVFTGALEHAIAIGLEGASFVSVFPRPDAMASARAIGSGSRLGVDTARLVAQREGVTAVVAGVISSATPGYVLSVHILDAVPGVPIASARHAVAAKDDVLPAMAAIARELRRGLGDHALESGTELDAETFTTASLDAAREYSLGQDLMTSGAEEQAIERFAAAVRHDPQFGRAYAGWGGAADRLGRTAEARALFDKALGLRDRMTRRERLRTEGPYMSRILRDHRAALGIYRTLATEFPADSTALNNVAVTEFMLLDFDRALETGRRAMHLHPTVQHHQNLALYALYAGDTRTASEQAQKALAINSKSALAYLPLAVGAILDGNPDQAQLFYAGMAGAGARGLALSTIGVADLEAFRGEGKIARERALTGLSSEATRTNARVSAALHLLLAEMATATNDAREAGMRARLALKADSSPATVFRSGEILALGGAHADARTQLDALAKSPDPVSAWYRRILAARLAGTQGNAVALTALEKAFETEPATWIARYAAGMMRLARGDVRAAISQFDWCLQHYAQSTAAYLDDLPTVRYLAQARYWRGRALDDAGDRTVAAQAYEEFLRARSPDDPLARDARSRLELLR